MSDINHTHSNQNTFSAALARRDVGWHGKEKSKFDLALLKP